MVDGGGAGQPGALATFTKACDAIVLGQARGSYLGLLDAESLNWLDVVQVRGKRGKWGGKERGDTHGACVGLVSVKRGGTCTGHVCGEGRTCMHALGMMGVGTAMGACKGRVQEGKASLRKCTGLCGRVYGAGTGQGRAGRHAPMYRACVAKSGGGCGLYAHARPWRECGREHAFTCAAVEGVWERARGHMRGRKEGVGESTRSHARP
eukprot:355731-Chlamydomonas_euryale.AAC.7